MGKRLRGCSVLATVSSTVLLLVLLLQSVSLCAWKLSGQREQQGLRESATPGDESDGFNASKGQQKHHPVVLVPGLGGSQLWAGLTGKKSKPRVFCARSTDSYFSLWISLLQLLPGVIDCTVDNLRLHYDPNTHTTHNTQGVDIQPLHFGHPRSVEWLDPYFDPRKYRGVVSSLARAGGQSRTKASEEFFRGMEYDLASKFLQRLSQAKTWRRERRKLIKRRAQWLQAHLPFKFRSELAYFWNMAEALVSRGYIRGQDLVAAPYDFRKAPNEMADFFNKTKQLIEETFSKNGNSRVVVVAHSMGNPVMLYFYNHVVSQLWKDRYIQSHVALAAPWGGAVKSLKLMISGDSSPFKFVKATKFRQIQRSMSSVAWFLPSPSLWSAREVLVTTPLRSYSTANYSQLFTDLDHQNGYKMWLDTKDLISDLKFPGVEMHCLYGLGVQTPERLIYTATGFPDHAPQVKMDNGDGTVNRRSLEAFLPWVDQQKNSSRPVRAFTLQHVDHMGIVKDPRAIQYVLNVTST